MVVDILVLGATGFTGKLVVQYLATHRDRTSFTFALGARSQERLQRIKNELGLGEDIQLVSVDVTNLEDVQNAVSGCRVVINTVGPFYKWGRPVVQACARLGKHYVDLAGELHYIRDIIHSFDFLASKTHACIIPAAGFDSIPSDMAAFLANKTLKALVGPGAAIEGSTSAVRVSGTLSGGTFATAISSIEDVPPEVRRVSSQPYSLSIMGAPYPGLKLLYTLPGPPSLPPLRGGLWMMAPVNKAVVQRTWALHTLAACRDPQNNAHLDYGKTFTYDEFLTLRSRLASLAMGLGLALTGLCLMITPLRWIFKRIVPSPGTGPSEEVQKKGFLELTNMTSSVPTADAPRRWVRTTIKGQGDPGYSLTAAMISEAALALALEHDKLPAMGQEGGVLTPMTALGDVLVDRFKRSGRFEIESEVIVGGEESRKTR
ncbi:hypothetical protein PUNSTDRAFT_136243 [Punctularia strigosozonata HHB-11173 SS5]|uniref:uncharacterized protein n=1 Tax=Punctularia strigosozonata (strain HHB-11173) TaxID=741275 RepID=UPI00044164A4|nr:uncharacterized protein PUNSTDRAFT_136243 [Punctularia strigosozonata HHB-11173 SS5]EIN06379.1 hypothetical protein PUNSTDRAFT_136243 [Punctularia strigosozonata HHB-11173 SS5]